MNRTIEIPFSHGKVKVELNIDAQANTIPGQEYFIDNVLASANRAALRVIPTLNLLAQDPRIIDNGLTEVRMQGTTIVGFFDCKVYVTVFVYKEGVSSELVKSIIFKTVIHDTLDEFAHQLSKVFDEKASQTLVEGRRKSRLADVDEALKDLPEDVPEEVREALRNFIGADAEVFVVGGSPDGLFDKLFADRR